MSDAELARYKALMEEDFRKNRLLPGDPGYEYDKQVHALRLRLWGYGLRAGVTAAAGGFRACHRGERLG
jgi:hypothetical protein